MDDRQVFEEFTQLFHQPAIWLTARILYGHPHERPDNSRRLLRILAETKNDLTAGTIAELLDIKPASVTQIIRKLEKNNYILRIKDQYDARITRLKITSEGLDHLNKIDHDRQDFRSKMFDIFSEDELDRLGKSLHKLNQHVSSPDFINSTRSNLDQGEQMIFDHLLEHHFTAGDHFGDERFMNFLRNRHRNGDRHHGF
ncbi:MarR family winged helix-turn-helix transcriptional regulator [Oenococcus alcoholitolerans]|uniref:HTH marR-type domain-containing protein n=1 Tax=Oenococcus alcoholitolerans TaxID=931074 RepID=A0ABR4XRN2_9LACO|nr:hypothetical protein Q757_02795 [Oenococcus alcoholitolerans]